jgi:defect-in-organelle-trafficking protein DotA
MGAASLVFMALGAFGVFSIGALLATIGAVTILMITVFPGLFAFMGVMLTLGGTLAIIIPFIPVLAYFLAVIAWLIATLETIVAAPIVAIGVLHPDGQHPVFGKAEPAIMLIINMFLRPSLLVIGFIAGIILSSISIQFVNMGFGTAVDQILANNDGVGVTTSAAKAQTSVSGIEIMLLITTYVGIILACVNKSFSVIEAIPNTIMRWIGNDGARFESGSDAMQKIQGSQEGSAQKSADSATQAAEASTHGPEKAAQAGGNIAGKSETGDKLGPTGEGIGP